MIGDRTYREVNGEQIIGKRHSAYIHNGGTYFLADIIVYKDAIIDCWELMNLDEFKSALARGWCVTTLPEGAKVDIAFLSAFTVTKVDSWIAEEEFLKEVIDTIEELNDRPTSDLKCREVYKLYQDNPTEELRAKLKQAYEAIPEHNRRYVLADMDVKDVPIRMIIYGEEEIENWSHWQVSKEMGIDPLPSITVPQPPKEET